MAKMNNQKMTRKEPNSGSQPQKGKCGGPY